MTAMEGRLMKAQTAEFIKLSFHRRFRQPEWRTVPDTDVMFHVDFEEQVSLQSSW
jgi:hypothetical protein